MSKTKHAVFAALTLVSCFGCAHGSAGRATYRFPIYSVSAEAGQPMGHMLALPVTVGAEWFNDHRAGEYFAGIHAIEYHTDLFGDYTFTRAQHFGEVKQRYEYRPPDPESHVELPNGVYTADAAANDLLKSLKHKVAAAIDKGKWETDPFYDLSVPSAKVRRLSALCTLYIELRPAPGVDLSLHGGENSRGARLFLGVCQLSSAEEDTAPTIVLYHSYDLTKVLLLQGPECVLLFDQLRALQDRIHVLAHEEK